VKLYHLANTVARGVLPFQPALRRLKRHLLPYEDDPANSEYCITQGLEEITALREVGVKVQGAEILEFGSGWLPLTPLLLHLAGARRSTLTDIARLMDDQTTDRAKAIVAGRIGDIAEVLGECPDTLEAKLQAPFAFDYLAPWHATSHPSDSADLILSRAVFEHVPEDEIRSFLRQFHRILRTGGAMCHVIDNSDHWQHRDRSLSRIDFLRYDEMDPIWRLAQINEQAYQNRLRHEDYRRLFEEAGFAVALERGEPDPKCLEDLRQLPIASRFRDKDPHDLTILTSLFVAIKR